jgi:hypothetical protein
MKKLLKAVAILTAFALANISIVLASPGTGGFGG